MKRMWIIFLLMFSVVSIQANNSKDDFDFEKYRKDFTERGEANLIWRKSEAPIRLISYALIDIDDDGTPEVWVRGDEGQDYQGVYTVSPEGNVSLINCSDAISDLIFYPGAVGSRSYHEGELIDYVQVVENSQLGDCCWKRVVFETSSNNQEVKEEGFSVNDRFATKTAYEDFFSHLGEPYVPDVQWHPCQ